MSEMKSLALRALKLDKRVSYRLARYLNALKYCLSLLRREFGYPCQELLIQGETKNKSLGHS